MTRQNDNIVEMHNIVKTFPGVRALDQANFSVCAGEVHGLVGENGAGKSTLIKILAGVYQRDGGEVHIRGQSYGALSPHLVETLGIQFIHQERYLVPHFTVAQSIFLGQEQRWGPLPIVNNRKMRQEAELFIKTTLGVSMDGSALIRDLSVAEAQMVQIAKSLIAKPSIIVFDEPTAPLARQEVENLFDVIRRLKTQGITIIYISHYLQEIIDICDRVTVLRNGSNVGTLDVITHTLPDEIVRLMVGRELVEMFPPRQPNIKDTILSAQNLSDGKHFFDINFELKRGEVLGITGLIGSGREELIDTVYGLTAPVSGNIILKAREFKRFSPVKAVENGIAMVPRDRRGHGLVLDMNVNDNINLSSLNTIAQAGFVRPALARKRSVQMIENLDIRPPNPEAVTRYLSGGNQQKVVVGRWLSSKSEVYLLDEPTVGIDVGAKVEIYQLINQLVGEGAGVLFISTDIPELLGTTDRILIMFRGRIIKEFKTKEATSDSILSWSTGGSQYEQ